ncbi:unnamed protein product, partial [Choristocarpus tenellus]
MIEDTIPAIKACLPRLEGYTIFEQQDKAKPQSTGGSWRIIEAIEETSGDDNVVETQPSNSPDLNINNLEFFHSITPPLPIPTHTPVCQPYPTPVPTTS